MGLKGGSGGRGAVGESSRVKDEGLVCMCNAR
jgi:hypothetical protein